MHILVAGSKGFVEVKDNGELVITPDKSRATQYETAGDAMRAAIDINQALGTNTIKIKHVE